MEINRKMIDIAMEAPIEVEDKIELLSLVQQELFELFDEDKITKEEYTSVNKYAYDVARKILNIK